MRREREIKLLRNRKRLNKRYSDFELGLLASEIIDYTYLLKSIQFPIDKYKIPETNKEKEKENEEKDSEKNKEVKNNNKMISLDEIAEEKDVKNEDSDEEYNGLKVKEKKAIKKRKPKRKRNNQN